MKVQPSMTPPTQPLQPGLGNVQGSNAAPPAQVLPIAQQPKTLTPPTPRLDPTPFIGSRQAAPAQGSGFDAVRQQVQPQGAPPPALTLPSSAPPTLPGQPAQPNVVSDLSVQQAKLRGLQDGGAGLNQIKNPVLRALARVGDIAGTVLSPGLAMAIPGTTMHNLQLQQQQRGIVGQGQAAQQAVIQQEMDRANLAHTQAETANMPFKLQTTMAQHGLKVQIGEDGTPQVVPDESSPVFQQQQAKEGLLSAQTDAYQANVALRNANAELAKLKQQNFDPNSPVFKLAEQRASTAQQNAASMSERARSQWASYLMHSQGVGLDGRPLAGAMLTDNGDTVGSVFSQNVRPTGTERNKGDMAASAAEQLGTIKDIVQKHPDMFGPGYGQSTQFQKWIGSQDPDAQRFLSARTIAADHLAGTFGGRSEAALTALDNAVGQFKDNPQAALAGIDQLTKANSRFQTAGSVKTVGNKANPMAPPANAPGAPKEGATKTNSSGDVLIFKNGQWGLR
jgi:hypothetical protein